MIFIPINQDQNHVGEGGLREALIISLIFVIVIVGLSLRSKTTVVSTTCTINNSASVCDTTTTVITCFLGKCEESVE